MVQQALGPLQAADGVKHTRGGGVAPAVHAVAPQVAQRHSAVARSMDEQGAVGLPGPQEEWVGVVSVVENIRLTVVCR